MPVTVSVRCKGDLVRKYKLRADTYGLSLNQYLKAKMLQDVGDLVPDFFNLVRYTPAERATILRGK